MTASPIGDAPPVLLALDAVVDAGERRRAPRGAAARVLPRLSQDRGAAGRSDRSTSASRAALPAIQRFYKVSKRILDDISTVAAAFALDLTPDGRVARRALAYGGIAATPIRAAALEERAAGQPWTRATIDALLSLADGVGTPLTDLRGSAAYRRAMTGRLLEKFVADTAPANEPVVAGR